MASSSKGSASSSMSTSMPLATRRQQAEEQLKLIERELFDMESAYIEDTYTYGNIVKGWEGYVNLKPKQILAPVGRKPKITDKERPFSMSSVTAPDANEYDDDVELPLDGERRKRRKDDSGDDEGDDVSS